MKAFLFPGQGSQSKGMGKEIFSHFKNEVKLANRILGFDIVETCLQDPNQKLTQTQFTQPAIFFVSALSYLKRIKSGEKEPDFAAGHSLGEFSALLAAKVFDLETGLNLVKKRGEVIAKAKNGGMAAIVGITGDEINKTLKERSLNSIDIANLNTRFQTVISGPKKDVLAAGEVFMSNSDVWLFTPLNVSGAFHSRYMKEAKKEFEEYLQQFIFAPPIFPVISNVTARPYQISEIKNLLVKQFTSPVKWEASMRYLMARKVKTFKEIGHGKILTGMINKILKESKPTHHTELPITS